MKLTLSVTKSRSIKFCCLFVYVFLLSGCKVNRYYYVSSSPLEVYGGLYNATRYQDIPSGDTIFLEKKWYETIPPSDLFYEEAVYDNRHVTISATGSHTYLYKRKVSNKVAKMEREKRLDVFSYPMYQGKPHRISSYGSNKGASGVGHDIQTGPRGGQFYMNSKGNKTYIKRK